MEEQFEVAEMQLATVSLKKYFGPKIEELSTAIDRGTDASERYARALVRATWVLAAATIILAISTVALVIVTASR